MSETLQDAPRTAEGTPPRDGRSSPTAGEPRHRRKQIVIVGGGFAGIAAAHVLRRSDADVLLIDRRNHHIFQPLLYQVATAVLEPSEISFPIRQLAKRQKNINVILGEVIGVDLHSRSIEASCPGVGVRKIHYDYLVIASGGQASYFGHDEFAAYAPGLKSLTDAVAIRTKVLAAYELADATDDETERARQMTFVLVGGGPAGVELAASMAQMAAVTLRGQFRQIDPVKSSIMLVEAGSRILPTFAASLAEKAARRLNRLGVTVLTDSKVENVDEDGVRVNGKRIPSATVLWTAGVAASPLVKLLGATTDRAGRVTVGPFLELPHAADVFVAGDASSVVCDGRPVPGVAQAAIQEGRYIGQLIAKELKGRGPSQPFRYRDKGNMAVVGKSFAVLESGRLRMSGFIVWLVWAFLHLMSLPQHHNRVRVHIQWLWSYLTGQRSSRLIPEMPSDRNH